MLGDELYGCTHGQDTAASNTDSPSIL